MSRLTNGALGRVALAADRPEAARMTMNIASKTGRIQDLVQKPGDFTTIILSICISSIV